jgi:hypothetical protein
MRIFLKAKHWQLFIALMGAMFLGQGIMVTSMTNGGQPSVISFVVAMLLLCIIYYGWLWAISSACFKALPKELASSPRIMQIGLIYALVYIIFGGLFFIGQTGKPPLYIVPMHLLAMAAIFYSFGFTAKQLTKLEQNKDVTFFNYSGPFFLLWFFPIGVWFIQPKVNQLLWGKNA